MIFLLLLAYISVVPHTTNAIAVTSLVDPFPMDSGSKVVMAGILEYLADRVGPANVHYLLVGGRAPGSEGDFPVRLHELPGPRTADQVASVVTHSATARRSLQEAIVCSPRVGKAIARLLCELGAGLEIYDTVRIGQYAGPAGAARQICYLDDLFSERYWLMLQIMRHHPGVNLQPLGTFARQVPRVLRPLATNRVGQRALLAAERRLIRRSEDQAARRFNTCLLVNPGEAERLRARAGVAADRVLSVPPLVQRPRPGQRGCRVYLGAPEFVFLGLLSQPHNEDGLRSFLLDVWPDLLRRRPDARLRVVGRQARPELRELVSRHGGSVSMEGFVADLDGVLSSAAAMINPLRFGTGIKIKIIEALGRGLPVVSSPIGADGIATGPDTGMFVAGDEHQTIDALLRLTDPEFNHAASRAARAHFTRHYSREAVFASYDRAFGFSG
jgi:glycosyltransferase involved in cell wall biosynthesis